MRQCFIYGLGLVLLSCTERIELFPPADAAVDAAPDAAPQFRCPEPNTPGADGSPVYCACHLACSSSAQCQAALGPAALCDPARGVCSKTGSSCLFVADCPSDPAQSWLCLIAPKK